MTKVIQRMTKSLGIINDQDISEGFHEIIFDLGDNKKITVRADHKQVTVTAYAVLVIEPAASNMIHITERAI